MRNHLLPIFALAVLGAGHAAMGQEKAASGTNASPAPPGRVEVELSAMECTFPKGQNPVTVHPTYAAVEKLPSRSVRLLDKASATGKSNEPIAAKHDATDAKLEAILDGTPTLCELNIDYHFHGRTDAADPKTLQDIHFVTSAILELDTPTVLNASAVPGREGTFIVIVARARPVNPDKSK